ncbi:MAG TPA: DUF2332 family protein [Symbiobacteriaceae bacterium]|nr:DUF2332 family protein [Symbiobacteriaceae bacterium]
MDHHQLRRLQAAFAARAETASPMGRLLCESLGTGPVPAVADVFGQFYRTISTEAPDVPLFLSALHHLALTGGAPDLAAFFPSCGGEAGPGVTGAAAAAVARGRDDLLDFLLSRTFQPHVVERSAALAAGARAVGARFGGGLSLVEFGCGGGLCLLMDKHGYECPPVVGRHGLDPAPFNPADPADRLVLESFFFPDEPERIGHLREAAAVLAAHGPLDIRQGTAEADLLALLAEAYATMPPGNTLLVMDSFVWPYLTDAQVQQVVWQIQHLAGRLEAHKPLAWLQLEPFGGGPAEVRLHTFGWSDPEDRQVRRLAETDWSGSGIIWLE